MTSQERKHIPYNNPNPETPSSVANAHIKAPFYLTNTLTEKTHISDTLADIDINVENMEKYGYDYLLKLNGQMEIRIAYNAGDEDENEGEERTFIPTGAGFRLTKCQPTANMKRVPEFSNQDKGILYNLKGGIRVATNPTTGTPDNLPLEWDPNTADVDSTYGYEQDSSDGPVNDDPRTTSEQSAYQDGNIKTLLGEKSINDGRLEQILENNTNHQKMMTEQLRGSKYNMIARDGNATDNEPHHHIPGKYYELKREGKKLSHDDENRNRGDDLWVNQLGRTVAGNQIVVFYKEERIEFVDEVLEEQALSGESDPAFGTDDNAPVGDSPNYPTINDNSEQLAKEISDAYQHGYTHDNTFSTVRDSIATSVNLENGETYHGRSNSKKCVHGLIYGEKKNEDTYKTSETTSTLRDPDIGFYAAEDIFKSATPEISNLIFNSETGGLSYDADKDRHNILTHFDEGGNLGTTDNILQVRDRFRVGTEEEGKLYVSKKSGDGETLVKNLANVLYYIFVDSVDPNGKIVNANKDTERTAYNLIRDIEKQMFESIHKDVDFWLALTNQSDKHRPNLSRDYFEKTATNAHNDVTGAYFHIRRVSNPNNLTQEDTKERKDGLEHVPTLFGYQSTTFTHSCEPHEEDGVHVNLRGMSELPEDLRPQGNFTFLTRTNHDGDLTDFTSISAESYEKYVIDYNGKSAGGYPVDRYNNEIPLFPKSDRSLPFYETGSGNSNGLDSSNNRYCRVGDVFRVYHTADAESQGPEGNASGKYFKIVVLSVDNRDRYGRVPVRLESDRITSSALEASRSDDIERPLNFGWGPVDYDEDTLEIKNGLLDRQGNTLCGYPNKVGILREDGHIVYKQNENATGVFESVRSFMIVKNGFYESEKIDDKESYKATNYDLDNVTITLDYDNFEVKGKAIAGAGTENSPAESDNADTISLNPTLDGEIILFEDTNNTSTDSSKITVRPKEGRDNIQVSNIDAEIGHVLYQNYDRNHENSNSNKFSPQAPYGPRDQLEINRVLRHKSGKGNIFSYGIDNIIPQYDVDYHNHTKYPYEIYPSDDEALAELDIDSGKHQYPSTTNLNWGVYQSGKIVYSGENAPSKSSTQSLSKEGVFIVALASGLRNNLDDTTLPKPYDDTSNMPGKNTHEDNNNVTNPTYLQKRSSYTASQRLPSQVAKPNSVNLDLYSYFNKNQGNGGDTHNSLANNRNRHDGSETYNITNSDSINNIPDHVGTSTVKLAGELRSLAVDEGTKNGESNLRTAVVNADDTDSTASGMNAGSLVNTRPHDQLDYLHNTALVKIYIDEEALVMEEKIEQYSDKTAYNRLTNSENYLLETQNDIFSRKHLPKKSKESTTFIHIPDLNTGLFLTGHENMQMLPDKNKPTKPDYYNYGAEMYLTGDYMKCPISGVKLTVSKQDRPVVDTTIVKKPVNADNTDLSDKTEELPVCCEAMIASCLACTKEQSIIDYCNENPDTQGCPPYYDIVDYPQYGRHFTFADIMNENQCQDSGECKFANSLQGKHIIVDLYLTSELDIINEDLNVNEDRETTYQMISKPDGTMGSANPTIITHNSSATGVKLSGDDQSTSGKPFDLIKTPIDRNFIPNESIKRLTYIELEIQLDDIADHLDMKTPRSGPISTIGSQGEHETESLSPGSEEPSTPPSTPLSDADASSSESRNILNSKVNYVINEQNRPSGFYDEITYEEGLTHLEEFRMTDSRTLQEINYVLLDDSRYTTDVDADVNNISRNEWVNLNLNGQETLLEHTDETIKDSVYRKDHTDAAHHVRTPLESLAKHYAHKYGKYGEEYDEAIDCIVSEWEDKGYCSVSCGIGTMTQVRVVTVVPSNGGNKCGPLSKEIKCTVNSEDSCPVDCELSVWSNWNKCSAECGSGVQQRTRSIVVSPENEGAPCDELTQTHACNVQSCNSDCVLAEWEWDECNVKCGTGVRTGTRGILVPEEGVGNCPPENHTSRLTTESCIGIDGGICDP